MIGIEDLAVGVVHHQSWEVTSRADRVARLGGAELSNVVKYHPAVKPSGGAPGGPTTPAAPPPVVPTAIQGASPSAPASNTPPPRPFTVADQASIRAAVQSFAAQNAALLPSAIDRSTSRIEPAVDRLLVHHVYTALARGQLTNEEKIYARGQLRALLPP